MDWKRNCTLNDDIRKVYTLVLESDWFGEDHAAQLYNNSERMEKGANESTVATSEDNKVDKYLVYVLRKFHDEFTANWVSCMDQKAKQSNNKIIFCSRLLHKM